MPKAKISVMISPRYSDTFGNSWIAALPLAACLLHGQEELHDHRHDEEIDEHRAEDEQDRRRDQKRQERLPLVLVEARRHEHVDLSWR